MCQRLILPRPVTSSLVFNATAHASEVRLYGDPLGTVLRAPLGSHLLAMLPGAPPVSLFNLRLEGQLIMRDGLLHVDECVVTHGRSDSLAVPHSAQENSLAAPQTRPADCDGGGGALQLRGGRFEARGSTFLDNYAASNGGAVCIDGGKALFDWSRFEDNQAEGQGGALFVREGSVQLVNGTYFYNNFGLW